MSACRALGLSSFLLCLAIGPLFAQDTRIRVVQSGGDNLLADLEAIVTSTPNKGLQKEWKNLNEILDSFLMGVHRGQPIRVDLVINRDDAGNASVGFEPSFPIAIGQKGKDKGKELFEGKGDTFLENVKGLGYKVKKTGDLYELVEGGVKGAKPMYLRHANGYAIISQSKKALPANLPKPTDGVAHLSKLNYDVAAELKNDAADEKARRDDFKSLRKELEAAIKFKRGEDESEFDLRKLGVVQFFDEMERFIVESNQLLIGWTTGNDAKQGNGLLTLSALDKTSLKDSIQLLSTKPSYFANVKLHDKEVLSGKMQFPFDEMRKEHAKTRHPLLVRVTELQIDKSTRFSGEEKAAAKEALKKLIEMFDETIDKGIGIEGFIDLHDIGEGANAGIAALRAEKAKNVDDIVALLPKISEKWNVKLKAVEHGGVSLHEVTVSDKYKEEFEALFGKETMFYIGASEKAVWAAAGKGSLDELKAAIDAVAQPAPEAPDPVFASVAMRFGPLVKVIDAVEKKIVLPTNATKQEVQAKKERDRIRLLALEAFGPGTELLTGKLSRVDGEVKGEMSINEGIFKFLGSAIADFSKQNLR